MKIFSEIKLYIQHCQQVVQVSVDEKCIGCRILYKELVLGEVLKLWRDFVFIEDIVDEMDKVADEQNGKLFSGVQYLLGCYEEIETAINNVDGLNELIQVIGIESGIMVMLLPFIYEHS